MNYQTNEKAYYAYARENRKTKKNRFKNGLIWFILGAILLGLVWTYLNYFTKSDLEINREVDNSNIAKVESVREKDSSTKLQKIESVAKVDVSNIKTDEKNLKSLPSALKANEANQSMISSSLLSPKILATSMVSGELTSKIIVNSEKNLSTESSLFTARTEWLNSSQEVIDNNNTKKSVEEALPTELFHLYIVSRGETIYDIARKQYGDTAMYTEIVNANVDLEDPNSIKAGQELLLPIREEMKGFSEILHFKQLPLQ